MKFITVKEWTYEVYFQGTKVLYTEVDVSDVNVLLHVRENTPEGRSGNVQSSSLRHKIVKVKEKKVQVTPIERKIP
jgi:hypothetical protein